MKSDPEKHWWSEMDETLEANAGKIALGVMAIGLVCIFAYGISQTLK